MAVQNATLMHTTYQNATLVHTRYWNATLMHTIYYMTICYNGMMGAKADRPARLRQVRAVMLARIIMPWLDRH